MAARLLTTQLGNLEGLLAGGCGREAADRLKDMIVTGGENVYAAEVESVISLMAEVREVAVIGAPRPIRG